MLAMVVVEMVDNDLDYHANSLAIVELHCPLTPVDLMVNVKPVGVSVECELCQFFSVRDQRPVVTFFAFERGDVAFHEPSQFEEIHHLASERFRLVQDDRVDVVLDAPVGDLEAYLYARVEGDQHQSDGRPHANL